MEEEKKWESASEYPGLIVRQMMPGEAEIVAAIEKSCFPDPWSPNSLRDMLGSPHSVYLVAEADGVVVGYCGSRVVLDEGDILRVAILESHRGRHIGSALLESLICSRDDVVSWNLDVREHNEPALRLYRKFGFRPIGRRRGYYHKPDEDAILMQRISEQA